MDMARTRLVKPGFFDNEVIAECDPLARILYIGLWCIADKEGRLEDRPKQIKKNILGYDDCDIEELLWQLSDKGFIVRYVADTINYIAIPKFNKHQRPHDNEAESVIPALESGIQRTKDLQSNQEDFRPRLEVLSTKEERASLFNLDPLTLNPCTSTCTPPSPSKEVVQNQNQKPETNKLTEDPIPYQDILNLYHQTLPGLSKVIIFSKKLISNIRARWNEGYNNLQKWQTFFKSVKVSDFLMGRKKEWKANLHWLILPTNFVKVINGHYVNPESVCLQAARDGPGKALTRLHGLFQEAKEERQCKIEITQNSAN